MCCGKPNSVVVLKLCLSRATFDCLFCLGNSRLLLDHLQNCTLADFRHDSSLLSLAVHYPILHVAIHILGRYLPRYLPESLVTTSVHHLYFYIKHAVFFQLALVEQTIYVSAALLPWLIINLSWCSVSAIQSNFTHASSQRHASSRAKQQPCHAAVLGINLKVLQQGLLWSFGCMDLLPQPAPCIFGFGSSAPSYSVVPITNLLFLWKSSDVDSMASISYQKRCPATCIRSSFYKGVLLVKLLQNL